MSSQPSPDSRHPSFLELDRHALGCAAVDTSAHMASCGQCQRYVAGLAPGASVPAWAAQLAAAPARSSVRPRAWPVAMLGLAAAACLMLFVARRNPEAAPYIGAKGGPAVAVYVSHAGNVGLWHGEALQVGDRIRLEVAPEAFEHVSVFEQEAGHNTLLYQGRVSAHARAMLPKAWQLSAASAAEHLAVVFSLQALSAEQAELQLRAASPVHAHVVKIHLSKTRP